MCALEDGDEALGVGSVGRAGTNRSGKKVARLKPAGEGSIRPPEGFSVWRIIRMVAGGGWGWGHQRQDDEDAS